LLRTNLTENDPAQLWNYYLHLVAVEQAFKDLKDDLAVRPNLPSRREAHRGSYLRRIFGLLSACYARTA